MIMMLFMMSMTMNMMFLSSKTPMSMLLIILVQTILICMFSGNIMMNYWMSYILFLIFLGGLMVIFIYITSIASNEMFNMKMKSMLLTIIIIMTMLMMYFLDMNLFIHEQFNSDMKLQNMSNMEMTESIKKLYNKSNLMTMMMMIYLLIAMIAVVKITNFYSGPIRKMYE